MRADEYLKIKQAIQAYRKYPARTMVQTKLSIETGRKYLMGHIDTCADLDAVTYERLILIEIACSGTRYERLAHWLKRFR